MVLLKKLFRNHVILYIISLSTSVRMALSGKAPAYFVISPFVIPLSRIKLSVMPRRSSSKKDGETVFISSRKHWTAAFLLLIRVLARRRMTRIGRPDHDLPHFCGFGICIDLNCIKVIRHLQFLQVPDRFVT